jgi:hypothetical protein
MLKFICDLSFRHDITAHRLYHVGIQRNGGDLPVDRDFLEIGWYQVRRLNGRTVLFLALRQSILRIDLGPGVR